MQFRVSKIELFKNYSPPPPGRGKLSIGAAKYWSNKYNLMSNLPEDPSGQTHEAILQLLDRQVGDDFFSSDAFEPTVSKWDGIPIIFSPMHPDLVAFETDPAAELSRIRELTGKRADIVGKIANARIEKAGHPKLMGDLVLNDDPDIADLITAGKLSHSTGFWCGTEGGQLKGSVVPNHLLIFEETPMDQPRDRGAVILNKEKMVAFTNTGRVLAGKNEGRLRSYLEGLWNLLDDMMGTKPVQVTGEEATQPEETQEPKTNMTDELIASKDAEIAKLKEAAQAMQNKVTEVEKKLSEIEEASKDAAWTVLKNKLPKGLVHTPEKEAETRTLFESDPFAFTNKILDTKMVPPTEEEGAAFTNKEDKNDPVSIGRELRMSTGRLR